jgi:hypothetical protein
LTEEGMPSEEELREQIARLRIDDVLLQTVVTLINLSGRKLTVEGEKDLEQAQKGIEAARALIPLLPEDGANAVRDPLAQLQMIYVRESGQPSPEEGKGPSPEDEERAKARSKIWTPGDSQ